jgi:hypothetical protein
MKPLKIASNLDDERCADARAAARSYSEDATDPYLRDYADNVIEGAKRGDVALFMRGLNYLDEDWLWTRAFRGVAQLKRVSPAIQNCFQLFWFRTNSFGYGDLPTLLDALRVLFPRYRRRSPVVLFRAAAARESEARYRTFGPSWTSDRATAERFASAHEVRRNNGSALLMTEAPAAAIIAAPGLTGPHWITPDGSRRHDEKEFLLDYRKLGEVLVVGRRSEISAAEYRPTLSFDGRFDKPSDPTYRISEVNAPAQCQMNALMEGLAAGDAVRFHTIANTFDHYDWSEAFTRVARLEVVPVAIQETFAWHWYTSAMPVRNAPGTLDALWKLLPRYDGPPLTVYRAAPSKNCTRASSARRGRAIVK